MPRPARRTKIPVPRAAIGLFSIACLLGCLVGCGYHSTIAGGASSRKADGTGGVLRLAVMGLRNDSPEPWLDRVLGDALRREMGLRSAFRLVSDPGEADLVLRGRIRPLGVRSNSFSSFVAALEYEVTLSLDLEVRRASGDVVRLDPRALTERELYLASPDIESTRTNRLEALRHLADILASRVADSLEMMEHPISAKPEVAGAAGG